MAICCAQHHTCSHTCHCLSHKGRPHSYLQTPHPGPEVQGEGEPTECSEGEIPPESSLALRTHGPNPLHNADHCCDDCGELQAPAGQGEGRDLPNVGECHASGGHSKDLGDKRQDVEGAKNIQECGVSVEQFR